MLAVSKIWRSIPSDRTVDQNVDANDEPPATRVSNNLYLYFVDDVLDFRGLSRLSCLIGIALCCGMQVLDTVSILRAFVNETTTIDIMFHNKAADMANPTVCFNIPGANYTAEIPHGPRSALKAPALTLALRHCLFALMSLEQAVFFPGNKTHEERTFSRCSELLRRSNATVRSMLNAVGMGLCSRNKLAWLPRALDMKPGTLTSLCQEDNIRWLGPYFPFHPNSVVCFGIPINGGAGVGIFADPFGGEDAGAIREISAFFLNDGERAFLRNSERSWILSANYVALRMSSDSEQGMELRKPLVYRSENLTRRPCFDANAKFDCERRCYNELIVKRCGYESVSYGDTRALQEAHQLFEKSITTCLLELTNAKVSSERDHCLDICRNLEQCEIAYTPLVRLRGEKIKTKYFSALIFVEVEPRMVFAEAKIYSDLEQIFAAIGGSFGMIVDNTAN